MLRQIVPEAIRHQGQALKSRAAMPQGSNFASPAPAYSGSIAANWQSGSPQWVQQMAAIAFSQQMSPVATTPAHTAAPYNAPGSALGYCQ
ncbi:TPA: hypothetical protein ACH3X1_011035 [Trebouxia sp. C0004]